GIGTPSRTSTPSMSVSQTSICRSLGVSVTLGTIVGAHCVHGCHSTARGIPSGAQSTGGGWGRVARNRERAVGGVGWRGVERVRWVGSGGAESGTGVGGVGV